MSKITNTSVKESNLSWLFGGSPRSILTQESRGQEELVNSEQLPTEIDGKEKLEALGVVFGEPLEDDPLFCNAQLPYGWKKRPTDHSMWSELVDASGNVVAGIFYKAAFYDRRAFMHFKE